MSEAPRQTAPREVDTVVIGGGTCGAALAGILAARSDRSVLLIEAGPDWGPLAEGRWPAALLDPTLMPVDDWEWNYVSAARHGAPEMPLQRARMIGGCSSHNGCAAVWGHRADYDAWEAAGNPGWGAAAMEPRLREADAALRVHQPTRDEITPWHRLCLDAAPAAGLPVIPSVEDLDAAFGIAIHAVNIAGRLRWNAAFAYLDPVRTRSNFAILPDTLVDRLRFDGLRCMGVEIVNAAGRQSIAAREVILAGGVFGSPLVLLRSGVGPAAELRALGISPALDLPGVGRNLQDHPAFAIRFGGSSALVEEMDAFVAAGGLPREEGTTALARSSRCEGPFDLHLYPVGSRPRGDAGWRFAIAAAVMDPHSTGTVRLASAAPAAPPIIDPGWFSDAAGRDLDVLLDGVELARGLAAQPPLGDVIGAELDGSPTDRDALRDSVLRHSTHDYHPVGTCKMGPASDPLAVVDARGRIHGLDGVVVADAAIMPAVPRANTNIPALAVALQVAS
ncbi:MAG TPA: GMC family oxidoreductase, partial [Thermomicrobiales bacterium]|nr:GMC family oxidoreductase [Thermomicrobiales bacterium]